MRDYCKQVCEHGENYGSTVPEHEYICEIMGKAASKLFVWVSYYSKSMALRKIGDSGASDVTLRKKSSEFCSRVRSRERLVDVGRKWSVR